jgi:hypothetical protein
LKTHFGFFHILRVLFNLISSKFLRIQSSIVKFNSNDDNIIEKVLLKSININNMHGFWNNEVNFELIQSRQSLGATSFMILTFGFIYLVSLSLDLIGELLFHKLHFITEFIDSLFEIPAIILDSILVLWIFYSLFRTLRQLAKKKQFKKMMIFNRIKYIILSYSLFSLVWLVYEYVNKLSSLEYRNRKWYFTN